MNNIAFDLVSAFNDGYRQGKADAEEYMLHCGDTDEPITNADRIRAMSDEEMAEELWAWNQVCCYKWTKDKILDWLKEEAEGRV